ncbi:hypothetical protein KI387_015624 [Taxus chinensis]|uniref:HMG box domain-containing protein n=1 Tax=Taxus chinensis TaxID=29808 RepID=A0AA38GGB7_TAXCH|nr:hypothetical protein KI387_015624 [Taxus chinensis]
MEKMKAKRFLRGKNDSIIVAPKEETADKENRGMPTPNQRGRKKESLKDVSNLQPAPSSSLEEELLAVRMRLQKLNIEKEKTDKLFEKRDAMLKQMEAELAIKAKAQENLQLQLKKFQKLKDIKPVLSFPVEQSLRMGELSKEQEKKKKKTDTNRLKKPSLPYYLWCQEQWDQMKSENPNITFKDMRAIMEAKWKALNAEEKKPYEEKYEAEKEAYLLNFPLEQSLRMGELTKEEEKKKKKTDPNRLKKPSPPYILWCQEQWNQMKSENLNITFKDMRAIMGAKWKTLNAEEKRPYEEKYEAEKEAYLQDVGKAKRENGALKLLHQERKQKTSLDLQHKKDAEGDEKGKRREKDPLKPKQPVTAFFAFTNERCPALLEQKHNVLEISKILGRDWNMMTKEEQAPYEQIAAEAKEHHLQEMELYMQKKAEELGDADATSAMLQHKIEMKDYNKRHHQIHFNVQEMEVGNSS